MNKRICLITGANAGIGKAAAIQIAQADFHVIIACRNEIRGKKALEEIKAASNSDNVELQILDLSSMKSIRDAASIFNEKHDKLDVLIHNAADFDISRKKPEFSDEGIETVWATNHIGPVLLTNLLLDKLKLSTQGRILTVASQGLVMYPNLVVDIADPEFKHKKFSVAKAYYQSKLAQLMYTYWLAEELKDSRVTVNCIRVTKVKIDINRYPDVSKFNKFLYSIKSKLSISPEKMAETYTLLATSPDLNSVTGNYFDEKNKEVKSSKYSRQPDKIKEVMELTKKYV